VPTRQAIERAAVALLLALALTACGREPRVHTVTIKAMAFDPAELTVARGDSVVWKNQDFFPHTATAAGRFDSASIDVGKSWRWEARAAGAIDYVCTLHPTMKGRIIVR
jgi:plastocyanin